MAFEAALMMAGPIRDERLYLNPRYSELDEKSVYEGSASDHATEGAALLGCSTIDVATRPRASGKRKGAGYATVDAPVSASIAAATMAR